MIQEHVPSQLEMLKYPETNQGYVLVTRKLEVGFWFECYTKTLLKTQYQEELICRLSFSGGTFQEILNAAKAWATAFGREFVVAVEGAVRKFFNELTPWEPGVLSELFGSIPSGGNSTPSSNNNSGGGLN